MHDIPSNTEVLRSHMFLKMKNNGILKARLVAGGDAMDRNIYDKSVRSSPTVHMENLFLLLGYVASNQLSICSMDVEGAFLEAELPEPIYMRLSADVSNVLCKLQPEVPRHGSSIIVKLKKALYGLVTASKLWYEKLKGVLVDIGLKPNDYDPCVFSGIFLDKTIHVCCYVDDLLICYSGDDTIPNALMKRLNSQFTAVKVDVSNPLVYIGMSIHRINNNVYVSMDRYEEDIIAFCNPTDKAVNCPNSNNLFERDTSEALNDNLKAKYHTIVAKLLYYIWLNE